MVVVGHPHHNVYHDKSSDKYTDIVREVRQHRLLRSSRAIFHTPSVVQAEAEVVELRNKLM